MNIKLEKKLAHKYKFMRNRNYKTGKIIRPLQCACACNDGWYDIINDLAKEITIHHKMRHQKRELRRINVVQIKEKFGTLRFYADNTTKTVDNIIAKYEDLSATTCELCGAPGKLRKLQWMQTLCDKCVKDLYTHNK